MVRFKKIPLKENEGKITYSNGIVDGIVLLAVSEIPYVELYTPVSANKMYNNSINVSFEKDGVHVDVVVKVHFSQSISEVAFKIQEAIRHNVEAMTEFNIANVNVFVKGVIFNEIVKEKKPEERNNENENVQEG